MNNFPFTKNIMLENRISKLEPLSMTHYEGLLKIALAYPNLLQYSPSFIGNEAALRGYIQAALDQREAKTRYAFAIIHKETGAIAGSSSFGRISDKNQHLEIGWTWLDKQFQGIGFNKANKFLMLQYVFERLEYERVEFRIDERNKRSRRAVEKIGGQYEGMFRSHTLMLDGHRRDTTVYSIIKAEWPQVKKVFFSDGVFE